MSLMMAMNTGRYQQRLHGARGVQMCIADRRLKVAVTVTEMP